MTFDELKALPTGAVVVWTFPDEEWADVKTDDSFRSTSNFQARQWIEDGHKVRVIWKPAPDFRVGSLVRWEADLWIVEAINGTTAELYSNSQANYKARMIPLRRMELVSR